MGKLNDQVLETMQFFSQCVGAALTRQKIGAHLVRAKQGYFTLSYLVRLMDPSKENINKALAIGGAIEHLAGVEPVRCSTYQGKILFEFPSPYPQTPNATDLTAYSKGANVVVGMDTWGKPVYINLKQYPTILFVGPPGRGKTTAMRSILFDIIEEQKGKLAFYIFSIKSSGWLPFREVEGYRGLYGGKTAYEALNALADWVDHVSSEGGRAETPIFVVIDDLINLLAKNSEIVSPISRLVSQGREIGVYALIGTQSAGSKAGTGGLEIEDNMAARVVYRTASRSGAARATGESSEGVSDLSDHQGDAILIAGGNVTRIATPYVTDEEVSRVLPKLVTKFKPLAKVTSAIEKEPDLPKISPARHLTSEELHQVKVYIEYMKRKGERQAKHYSINTLSEKIYGYSGGPTKAMIREGLERLH